MGDPSVLKTYEDRLPPIRRYVTTHSADGKAVLSSAVPEDALNWQRFPGASMFLSYTTTDFPVSLQDDADVIDYEYMMQHPPGLFFPGSSICRILDLSPGDLSPMHRTQTLDYGIVLEGEVELILEDIENPTDRRIMRRGDTCVQRATLHAWRNTSATEWARMVFVLIACEKPLVNGKALGEDLNRMDTTLKEALRSA